MASDSYSYSYSYLLKEPVNEIADLKYQLVKYEKLLDELSTNLQSVTEKNTLDLYELIFVEIKKQLDLIDSRIDSLSEVTTST